MNSGANPRWPGKKRKKYHKLDVVFPEDLHPLPKREDRAYPSIPKDANLKSYYTCVQYKCKQTYLACLNRRTFTVDTNLKKISSMGYMLRLAYIDPYCTQGECKQGNEIAKHFTNTNADGIVTLKRKFK